MTIYTAITFAPVQGFIEKSRKLRDLYGGSFLLSYLARAICDAAEEQGCKIVSPAIIDVTQGTPNQIIIAGEQEFSEIEAKSAFNSAWQAVVKAVREKIEKTLPDKPYHWHRDWNAWNNHAWEFFYASGKPGESISDVRQKLNEVKRGRNWIGVNWIGESSTLSGGDAVAWYGMSDRTNPKTAKMSELTEEIKGFYKQLSNKISNSIIDEGEQLSIPELVKRLITLKDVGQNLNQGKVNNPIIEIPETFRDINRKNDESRWTGWFQGDGDKIGKYLQDLVAKGQAERDALNSFSMAMLNWGKELQDNLIKATQNNNPKSDKEARVIYAGGDDFLGVFYRNDGDKLTAQECLNYFYKFPEIWRLHQREITVSVGFVWAGPKVPQRDVLQHADLAEKSAKRNGRDRIAIRILFNSGNHLEWTCPWWLLKDVIDAYRDRQGGKNWTHIYNDVAVLESRHAFQGQKDIALELFEIYFFKRDRLDLTQYLWNGEEKAGILGERNRYKDETAVNSAVNAWIINLAKIGFHLCQQQPN